VLTIPELLRLAEEAANTDYETDASYADWQAALEAFEGAHSPDLMVLVWQVVMAAEVLVTPRFSAFSPGDFYRLRGALAALREKVNGDD
jgi:hypothetical protein